MDICTYLKQGIGRHADSMGNRGTFKTPGMQWISVGNGIEHAEGGGTPKGETEEGFQLWFNTPSEHKKKDPRYGTEELPSFPIGKNGKGTVLVGPVKDLVGPFLTVQPIQVVDIELGTDTEYEYVVPESMDTCILFVYNGEGTVSDTAVDLMSVVRMDAEEEPRSTIRISTSTSPMKVMAFAGKRIHEPIAWQGPFVMNNDKEIGEVIRAYRSGRFPPVRTKWDYRVHSEFPKE
jgi:redox-sensitive bicupin YhaK (pirin superfamily)